MSDIIIVSRHKAVPEFIAEVLPEAAGAPVYAEVDEATVRGKTVIGNLPMNLAAIAGRYIAVEYPAGNAPRGSEYSLDDMKRAGARLVEYRVERVREIA